MRYKYTGNIELSDLEDKSLTVEFQFEHEEQLIHTFVKHYAVSYVFDNNLAPTSYCRIGTLGYSMGVITDGI